MNFVTVIQFYRSVDHEEFGLELLIFMDLEKSLQVWDQVTVNEDKRDPNKMWSKVQERVVYGKKEEEEKLWMISFDNLQSCHIISRKTKVRSITMKTMCLGVNKFTKKVLK